MRQVLLDEPNIADSAVHEIGERDVDQPVAAAHGEREFDARVGEGAEARALAAGENDGEHTRFVHGSIPHGQPPPTRSARQWRHARSHRRARSASRPNPREWANRGKNTTPERRASTLALIAALAVASCSSPVPPAASPSASETASVENAEDGNRVQRYGLTGEGGQLRLSEPETILQSIPAAGNHSGSRIAFGRDGKLYVGTGDAGQRELSQDLDSLAGKILCLNPDGSRPADSTFDDSLVYSYGHRNVQGLAWTSDGTMYASEFGASTFDELNRIEPGGNYGWPEAEGDSGGAFLATVAQCATSEASPSGIAIRGEDVFIANLRGRSIRRVNLADPSKQQLYLAEENTRFHDVAVSPTGEVWVLTNNIDRRGDPGPEDDRLLRLDIGD